MFYICFNLVSNWYMNISSAHLILLKGMHSIIDSGSFEFFPS